MTDPTLSAARGATGGEKNGGEKSVVQRYGQITPKFFDYITPQMIATVVVICAIMFYKSAIVSTYFMHSPYLNGLMVLIVATGVYMVMRNNYALYSVAGFLKQIEKLEQKAELKEDVTDQELHQLRTQLETRGHLLSMAQLNELLSNLQAMGTMIFTDADARLIKSKLGARISGLRTKVNYLTGILVMLGLIGTFWGLLGTITAVGEAMTRISGNFVDQAKGAEDAGFDIGGFISSISKPLEGMGIGFSASLFGLAGSLFVGFMNYIGSMVHNRFIENFSRWVDDRIPRISPSLSGRIKGAKVPSADDLKAWLAGFVYLSSKMSQRMEQLFSALTKTNETAIRSLTEIERLHDRNQQILSALESGNRGIIFLRQTLEASGNAVLPALSMIKNLEFHSMRASLASDALRQRVDGLNDSLQTVARNIMPSAQIIQNIHAGIEDVGRALASGAQSAQDTGAKHLEHLSVQNQRFEQLSAAMTEMAASQAALLKEITAQRQGAGPTASQQENAVNREEIKAMVDDISAMLSDIRKNTEDAGLVSLFRKGAEAAPE
jgi:biopolymer transport protein ExbB/TolQ